MLSTEEAGTEKEYIAVSGLEQEFLRKRNFAK
jgi:hypothetical protein